MRAARAAEAVVLRRYQHLAGRSIRTVLLGRRSVTIEQLMAGLSWVLGRLHGIAKQPNGGNEELNQQQDAQHAILRPIGAIGLSQENLQIHESEPQNSDRARTHVSGAR